MKFGKCHASFATIALAVLPLISSPLSAAVIVTPTIQVQTLTHSYSSGYSLDSISIGSGYTGGGAFSVPSISNGDTATIRVQAPAGEQFVVHDPNAQLNLNFYWQATGDSISLFGGTVDFENLTGPTPPTSYSLMGVGSGGNVILAELQFDPVGLISFTALDITIPVQSSPPGGPHDFGSVQSTGSLAFYADENSPTDHIIMSLDPIVPEPASLGLLAMGGLGLLLRRRNKR